MTTDDPIWPGGTRTLEEVRREIDSIDDSIHDLLMRRHRASQEVSAEKSRIAQAAGEADRGSVSPIRPAREAQLLRRLAARHDNGPPLNVVLRVWREIIAASTLVQGALSVCVYPGSANELVYWDMARFYYGSATPMTMVDSPAAALRKVFSDRTAVAILPAPDNLEPTDPSYGWWTQLMNVTTDAPRIVARLPFLAGAQKFGPAGEVNTSALAIAHAPLEPSGDDVTLVAVSSNSELSPARTEALLGKAGLTGRRLDMNRSGSNNTGHWHLVSINGFIADATDLNNFIDQSDGTIDDVRILGAYANPIAAPETT